MKKNINKLVIASYSKNNELDEMTTSTIAARLSRKELRAYIRALKQYEKKKQVIVDCASSPAKEYEEILRSQFPNKNVLLRVTPDLLLGIRITDNDIVYDMNLKHTLEKLEDFIEQQYD